MHKTVSNPCAPVTCTICLLASIYAGLVMLATLQLDSPIWLTAELFIPIAGALIAAHMCLAGKHNESNLAPYPDCQVY